MLVPDGGGWLRQFGHVEDLADAMAAMLGHRAAFGHRRRGRQEIQQHLHCRRAAPLETGQCRGPVPGRREQPGQPFEHRLRVDAAQCDRVLPPDAARVPDGLLHTHDAGDHAEDLLVAACLRRRFRETHESREDISHVRRSPVALELGERFGRPRRQFRTPRGGGASSRRAPRGGRLRRGRRD